MMLASPTGGFAQDQEAQAESADFGIEEIVVTSRRREEFLQDTPIAVSAIIGAELRSMGIGDFRDLTRFVPNMSSGAIALGGNHADNITIRGIGSDRIFPSNEQATGIYIDDVLYPRVAGNIVEMVELERVEVLRGPQGTLFGRNSIAGTIRYVTKKPTGEFGGNVEATTGRFNRLDARGSVNFPFNDKLSGLISFGKDTRDGFVTHDTDPGRNGSRNTSTLRAKIRYVSDALTVDLSVTDITMRTNGRPFVVIEPCPTCFPFGRLPFAAPDDPTGGHPDGPFDDRFASQTKFSIHGSQQRPDFFHLDQTTIDATITLELSENLTVKSITANTWLSDRYSEDLDGSNIETLYLDFGDVDKYFQQELQLLGNYERFRFVAGLFYFRERPRYFQNSYSQLQEATELRIRDQFYKDNAIAGFFSGTFNVTDQLAFTAGIRYSHEKKSARSVFTKQGPPEAPGPFQGQEASVTESWDSVTPHFDITYNWTDDLMTYASASRGFKSGGINFNIDVSPNPVENKGILPFAPERAWTYEIGLKLAAMNRRLIANVAAFYTVLKGQQLQGTVIFEEGFFGLQVNAGKFHTSGLELEVQAVLSENFRLRGSAAYFNGKYDSIGAAGVTGLISENSKLANSPDWSFAIGGVYSLPLNSGAVVFATMDFGWRDDVQPQANSNNEITIEAYGILNAGLEYIFPNEQVSLSIRATNLTNKYYFTFFQTATVPNPFASVQGDLGRPREWSLSVGYRF